MSLPLNSRYLDTEVIKHNGKETLGRWPGTSWIDIEPAKTIVVSKSLAGRLDLIASRQLGDAGLWWAIMYYNRATDVNWPRAGDEVKIPPRSYVLGE